MLNQDKIRLMTRAAIYEKHEGKEDLKINRYGRSDYVRFSMLKTLIGVTVSVAICCVLYLVCTSEDIFELFFQIDLQALLRLVAVAYILALAVYIIISILFYQYKYSMAQKRLKRYQRCLTLIEKIEEEEAPDSAGGGKRHG